MLEKMLDCDPEGFAGMQPPCRLLQDVSAPPTPRNNVSSKSTQAVSEKPASNDDGLWKPGREVAEPDSEPVVSEKDLSDSPDMVFEEASHENLMRILMEGSPAKEGLMEDSEDDES